MTDIPNGPRDIITIMIYKPKDLGVPPACAASQTGDAAEASDSQTGGSPPEEIKSPANRKVRVIEDDMQEFFESCVQVYAQLTDTDPVTYPHVGTPYGSKLANLEDGQGGPRGEVIVPAMEALAVLLHIDAKVGKPDRKVVVKGPGF